MKMKFDNKYVELIPENDDDWFTLGRISVNMKCEVQMTNARLEPVVSMMKILLSDLLTVLSNTYVAISEESHGE